MLRIKPLIRLMTQEELRYHRRDNTGFVLVYDYKSYILNCSSNDYIDAYVEGVALYVLTINSRRKYIALEAYQIGHAEAVNAYGKSRSLVRFLERSIWLCLMLLRFKNLYHI
jgi:hypothetical protein